MPLSFYLRQFPRPVQVDVRCCIAFHGAFGEVVCSDVPFKDLSQLHSFNHRIRIQLLNCKNKVWTCESAFVPGVRHLVYAVNSDAGIFNGDPALPRAAVVSLDASLLDTGFHRVETTRECGAIGRTQNAP